MKPESLPVLPQKMHLLFLRALLIILPILGLIHFYIGYQLSPILGFWDLHWVFAFAYLLISVFAIVLGMSARYMFANPIWVERITWLGTMHMGFFSSLLVLTVIRNLTTLISDSAIWGIYSAFGVPILALSMTVIGFWQARRSPKVVNVEIPIQDLPESLQGFRIVQVSDLHVSATLGRGFVENVVQIVNSLNADVVALTGDLVDGSVKDLADKIAPLGSIHSQYGSFFVTGNHEYYAGVNDWLEHYRSLGFKILRNEHRVIVHQGSTLIIAGVNDYNAGAFDDKEQPDAELALLGAPKVSPKILLAHQPRAAFNAEAAGFDLQLSGHTHGGQFWPWIYFVKLQQPFVAGLRKWGKLWVYTSRGTGYWGPPNRLGAHSEITLLRLIGQA